MKQLLYKNIQIAYSETGKGTALILLHGFLENATMWDYYQETFAREYHVITIDLLGHGQTGCLGYIHTMEDMADAVHAVLDHLHIKKAIFTGHSMGGYVSLAFAELYPDYIKGMVLLNSTSYQDSDERKANRDRAVIAVKKDYTAFIRMSIANLFSEGNREKLSQAIEAVKIEALKTPLQGIVAALEGMKIRKDREKLLHLADFPILLVLGEKDPVLNYTENKKQLEGTSVQFASFPDGHMTAIENKEELGPVLLDFFRTC
ncbi:alpha/beta fold hydrolase [Flavobacterium humi]|uniref:Alpha/beta hydrolase n=1 Tax=Flavobacterium humi TaxID=2562683 RepID=A0A4Z0L892_9FLAO|nr:alpha/beta hydrolase [Flavobacterium humi]TGD58478.1 alpha/beta hydrolase [Flavobacterium humi]